MMAYLAIAFSNMMATTCQYEALRYVSFPTQTLAKTAKMIPVMIWGTLLSRRAYKLKDYIVAGGVTLGTTCFLLTGEVTAKQAKAGDKQTTLWGVVIMVAYLFFDGFTSTVQERLFKNREVSTWNQMLYVGLLSGLLRPALLRALFGLALHSQSVILLGPVFVSDPFPPSLRHGLLVGSKCARQWRHPPV